MSVARIPKAARPRDTEAGPPGVLAVLRHLVEEGIAGQPRSRQRTIGPSELGTSCDFCLAARLAGWEKSRDIAWLPWIGTQVHAGLERILNRINAPRFLIEQRVTVGEVDGTPITGTTDLFDKTAGIVVDWKCVGDATLKNVRANGPRQVYRTQAHLYGRGWVNAGHRVETVMVVFLPRNAANGWGDGYWWHEPYDENIARAALDRATKFARNIRILSGIGNDARDSWVAKQAREPGCYNCPRFDPTMLPAGPRWNTPSAREIKPPSQ